MNTTTPLRLNTPEIELTNAKTAYEALKNEAEKLPDRIQDSIRYGDAELLRELRIREASIYEDLVCAHGKYLRIRDAILESEHAEILREMQEAHETLNQEQMRCGAEIARANEIVTEARRNFATARSRYDILQSQSAQVYNTRLKVKQQLDQIFKSTSCANG